MRAHPAGKLGEGATAVSGAELCERLFQSTPPARGRQANGTTYDLVWVFQSAPPREGGDKPSRYAFYQVYYFNPRPPRGGRRGDGLDRALEGNFNPRPPRGGRRWNSGMTLWH